MEVPLIEPHEVVKKQSWFAEHLLTMGSLASGDERIAALERRVLDLMERRDGPSVRNRAIEAEQAIARVAVPAETDRGDKVLLADLEHKRAHAEALEEKVAVLVHAAGKLSTDLEAQTARRRTVEAELSTVEAVLAAANRPIANGPSSRRAADGETFAERTLLYVGGRPRQVEQLRRFVEARGGRLLSYDGGIADSMALPPGFVSRRELVLFPVECVSHEAAGMVKRVGETAASRSMGLSGIPCAGGRLNIRPPWPG